MAPSEPTHVSALKFSEYELGRAAHDLAKAFLPPDGKTMDRPPLAAETARMRGAMDRRPTQTMDNGNTALHAAAKNPPNLGGAALALIVQSLGEPRCEIDAANCMGHTALHMACMEARHDFVRGLLLAGADPLARSGSGDQPLHLGAAKCHPSALACLLEHGADPTALGAQKLAPWELAKDSAFQGSASLLLLQAAERSELAKLGADEAPGSLADRPRL